jgi:DNA-binding MarR family transcriptional regulator
MLDRRSSKPKHDESPRAGAAADSGQVAAAMVIVADRYVSGLVRAIANKVEGDASRFYRKRYSVGLSEWHILMALAADSWITSPVLCKNANLDKAAVVRGLVRMEEQGLVLLRDKGRHSRATALSAKGRRLHDRIAQAAMAREEQLLAEFSPKQVDTLIDLLTALSKAAVGLTKTAPQTTRRSKTV